MAVSQQQGWKKLVQRQNQNPVQKSLLCLMRRFFPQPISNSIPSQSAWKNQPFSWKTWPCPWQTNVRMRSSKKNFTMKMGFRILWSIWTKTRKLWPQSSFLRVKTKDSRWRWPSSTMTDFQTISSPLSTMSAPRMAVPMKRVSSPLSPRLWTIMPERLAFLRKRIRIWKARITVKACLRLFLFWYQKPTCNLKAKPRISWAHLWLDQSWTALFPRNWPISSWKMGKWPQISFARPSRPGMPERQPEKPATNPETVRKIRRTRASCQVNWPLPSPRTQPRMNSIWSRVTLPVVLPSRAVTASSRPFYPYEVRSSTPPRPRWQTSWKMKKSTPWFTPSVQE